jgi:hypothetical protein
MLHEDVFGWLIWLIVFVSCVCAADVQILRISTSQDETEKGNHGVSFSGVPGARLCRHEMLKHRDSTFQGERRNPNMRKILWTWLGGETSRVRPSSLLLLSLANSSNINGV